MTLTSKRLRLKKFGIVTMVAGALLGQSAFAGAEEQRDRPSPAVVTTAPPSSSPAVMLTVGGTLADLFTTLSVLNSNAGREANPILGQSPARIIAVKSALLVPQLIAEHHLATHGHPKAAMWLGIAFGGLGTAMAIHNMNVGR
jgi:hypothetical protein